MTKGPAPRKGKPEPVNKNVVCSVCGLKWEAHGLEPELEDCIRLLKAEVAKPPLRQLWPNTYSAYTIGGTQ